MSAGVLFLTGLLSSPFSPLQQFEESKSEKAKSGVLESSVDEETKVHSGSLIWPGALCHDFIPRKVGFVKGPSSPIPASGLRNLRVNTPISDTVYS